jgi:sugar phosphate isomerase/epimerase
MLSRFRRVRFVETTFVFVADALRFVFFGPVSAATPRKPREVIVIEHVAASASRQVGQTFLSGGNVRPTVGTVQNDSVKSPQMSRLSVNQITTIRRSLRDDLQSYREEGFEAAGLWRPKFAQFDDEERAVELVRESGLTVSSLSFAGGFTGLNQASFFDAVDDARHALRLAGALGAECLTLVSGPRRGHVRSHARRLLVDAVKALADDAAEQGVALALEPMSPLVATRWSFLNSLDETLDVIDRSGRGARIAFDVYHLWQEPRIVDRIPELAPHVAVVRLSDWRGTPRSEYDRCLPGNGRIPLTAIVHAFDESGYGGYYELAIWSEELWKSDYTEMLRECRARFDVLCRRQVPLQTVRR